MDTLADLQNAITSTADAAERADLWLHAGAKQSDKGNYASAITMLNNARDLVASFAIGDARDKMVSQIAFEYARAQDTTRAQNALQYIASDTIEDQTRARIAVTAAKVNATTAQAIADTISDSAIKDNAWRDIAYECARRGELNLALTFVAIISDAGAREAVSNQAKRYASEVIT